MIITFTLTHSHSPTHTHTHRYTTGKSEHVLNSKQCCAMSHYLRVHQQRDGGWGTHIESPSTMFGSVLCYVALRLLGADKDDDACIRGRKFILKNGGALYTSSWAKFGLCLLGVMDWRGHNPVPPEFFLLPNWFPFHPGRMWCHARMVYLPMSVLYGNRVTYERANEDPVTISLREELYVRNYDKIEWSKTRHWIAPMDNYSPIGTFMRKYFSTFSLSLSLSHTHTHTYRYGTGFDDVLGIVRRICKTIRSRARCAICNGLHSC